MTTETTTRTHDLADGCPDDSAEHWRDLYQAMDREASKARTEASRLLQQQVRHDRDVYAAAKRDAWDEVLRNANLHVKSQAARELRHLVFNLTRLPEKPRPVDIEFIRTAARDVTTVLNGIDVEAPGTELAELHRLRNALTAAGQQLHKVLVPDETGHCRCRGCELIRQVYAAPLPSRCGLCGSRRCDQPGGPTCVEAQYKRQVDV
jgi:hypothetical protein